MTFTPIYHIINCFGRITTATLLKRVLCQLIIITTKQFVANRPERRTQHEQHSYLGGIVISVGDSLLCDSAKKGQRCRYVVYRRRHLQCFRVFHHNQGIQNYGKTQLSRTERGLIMETKNTLRKIGNKIFNYVVGFLAIVLAVTMGFIFLSAVVKVLFAYEIYGFFLGKVSTIFGLDLMPARLIAIFLAIAALLVLPTILSFIFLGRHKKEILIMVSAVTVICFLSMYYGTNSIFFSRTNGKPIKYYVKTLEGFKFSSTGDFDPVLGAKFKPITPEIAKEYYVWRETGKLGNIPKVKAGKYFDRLTGDPIVWYSEAPDGKIKLSPLPGHDTATGLPLKPMTPEVAQKNNVGLNFQATQTSPPGEDKDKEALKIDLNWYFNVPEYSANLKNVKEYAVDLRSESLALGHKSNRYVFELAAEKIIFIPPHFTIIGICFHAIVESGVYGIGQIYVLDSRGTKYQPIQYLGTEGDASREIKLTAGERKRVFIVLNHIPPEKLKSGGISWGNIHLPFYFKQS